MKKSLLSYLAEAKGQTVWLYTTCHEATIDSHELWDGMHVFAKEADCLKALIADLKQYEGEFYAENEDRIKACKTTDDFAGLIDDEDFSQFFRWQDLIVK